MLISQLNLHLKKLANIFLMRKGTNREIDKSLFIYGWVIFTGRLFTRGLLLISLPRKVSFVLRT